MPVHKHCRLFSPTGRLGPPLGPPLNLKVDSDNPHSSVSWVLSNDWNVHYLVQWLNRVFVIQERKKGIKNTNVHFCDNHLTNHPFLSQTLSFSLPVSTFFSLPRCLSCIVLSSVYVFWAFDIVCLVLFSFVAFLCESIAGMPLCREPQCYPFLVMRHYLWVFLNSQGATRGAVVH